MMKTKENYEQDVLNRFKMLPEDRMAELLDFLDFLIQRVKEEKGQGDIKKAVSAVENTWNSIKLDRNILKYIAEDKEIEYEIR